MTATKTRPPHRQGKTYNTGCRCTTCTKKAATQRATTRWKNLQRSRGALYDDDKVDPREAVKLIKRAKKRGMSYREIARVVGVQRRAIEHIVHGDTKQIRRDTERNIFRALGDHETRAILPRSKVDGKWSRAMIMALCAQGFTVAHQQELLQRYRNTHGGFLWSNLRFKPGASVHEESRQHMVWLVNAIGDQVGPSKVSISKQFKRGYFPTKHYDAEGNLIYHSLSPEQKAVYDSV